jgi:molybdopterin/thiamine biosynthesis adenylyltransferase
MTFRLTDPDKDRYERLRLIRWWEQSKISKSSVLVAGAGALGNEVVKNLALLGVGEVNIVDLDRIETTNLTRSALFRGNDVGKWKAEVLAERAHELNPDVRARALRCDARFDLGLGFLKRMDIVFGCLDNREARYYINRSCYLLQKIFIDGGLDTLNGSVSVFHPPRTACYECTLGTTDRQELQKRISCLKSADPELKHHVPTAPTIASIIGGLQTQIAIRAIHGLAVPAGKRIGLYGLTDLFFEIALEQSADCGLHSTLDPLPDRIESIQGANTPKEALTVARKQWQANSIVWDFDRDLTVGLTCGACGRNHDFKGIYAHYEGPGQCVCGGDLKPQITTGYSGNETWGAKTFRDLGFPVEHIYAAETPSGRIFFETTEKHR